MGEIFARELPARALGFTGERMTSEARGQIEYEHLHRYFFARELVRGGRVLDVASGEGFGGALLAQTARDVIGVEISPDAVRHAASAYRKPNLRFVQGDGRSLPIKNGAVDFVVSFETVEHLLEQRDFLSEVRRVLCSGGILIMSSPDRDIYSPVNGGANEFHVKELTKNELDKLASEFFKYRRLYMQRAVVGSVIIGDADTRSSSPWKTFESRGAGHFETSSGLSRAPYLILVASDDPRALGFDSVFIHTSDVNYGGLRATEEADTARREAARMAQLAEALRGRLASREAELDRLRDEARQLRAMVAPQPDTGQPDGEVSAGALPPDDPRCLLIAAGGEPAEFALRNWLPGTGWYAAESGDAGPQRCTGPEPRFSIELFLPAQTYLCTMRMKPNDPANLANFSVAFGGRRLPFYYSLEADGLILLRFEVPTSASASERELGVITFRHGSVGGPMQRESQADGPIGFRVASLSFAPGRLAPLSVVGPLLGMGA
jgi:SAM-dependent methyltransferase